MNQNDDTADLLSSLSDSVAIDYGVITAIAWPADPTINATSGNNCTVRFKNGCSPREKLHFRFWPGNVGDSTQTSQGVMALVVMAILLCLVLTYCCWGTCCKLFQKRRRQRQIGNNSRSRESFDSCSSDPRLMTVVWPPPNLSLATFHQQQHASSRSEFRHPLKTNRVCEAPPPPYDALFGSVHCSPPTYSSLGLSTSSTTTEDAVTVVVETGTEERSFDPSAGMNDNMNVQRVGQGIQSQSVPSSIGSSSSSQITHIAVLFCTENREA